MSELIKHNPTARFDECRSVNETGTRCPVINFAACVGCGSCLAVCICEPNVFALHEGLAIVANPESCVNCERCTIICPADAITLE